MLGFFPALEGREVERRRRSALFRPRGGLAEGVDLEASFLLAPDQVTDRLAIVGVMTGMDLRRNPGILLLSQA